MRHLSTKLLLALGMLLPLFYGCGNDDDGPTEPTAPTITSLTPDEGPVGTSVTIAGTNFGTSPSVSFDGTSATPTNPSTTSLTVTVPSGLSVGEVDVTVTSGGETSAAATFTVTESDTPEPPGADDTFASPGDTLANIADLSALTAALDTTGLTETLNGEGLYTIFAPNNAAFQTLLDSAGLENLDALIAEVGTEALASILQGHVVNDSLSSTEVAAAVGQDSLETLSGAMLGITMEGENLFVNGAQIIQADIFTSNGVIHVIDSVINAAGEGDTDGETNPNEMTTVADTISSIEDLNMLEAALTATNLVEPLNGEGPFTVFAPSNAAFDALLAAQEVADLQGLIDKLGLQAVTTILQAHVVLQNLPAASLTANQSYNTLVEGKTVTITQEGSNVFVNGSQVLTPDIIADNGVVHIIDSVINLPMAPPAGSAETVVDTIAVREDLSSLEAALTATELIDPLSGAGPFTVFAPDNAAFDALLNAQRVNTLQGLINKIGVEAVADILQAHVVSGQQLTSDMLFDQDVYESMEGSTLTITADGEGMYVNGALISESDLVTGNGVVHIIDQVVNTTAANTGANGFTVTIENVSSARRFFQQGTFGVDGEGTVTPAGEYQFTFHAGRVITGTEVPRLSFVAMVTGTFDEFIATPENGIALYDGATPLTGDITNQLNVYDAGTEDETGADIETPGPVQSLRSVTNEVTVTIAHDGGSLFTVTIADGAAEGGISPGVFGVHTVDTPIFGTTRSAGSDGLEALAEDGDPTALSTTMALLEGFAVPLSPGVFAIHGTGVTPILVPGQADFGQGLEALAEDGNTETLAASLMANAQVDSSGTFAGIPSGESVSFTIENVAAGDVLSLATMMVQSNDIVYATSEVGIPLFDETGDPINGNVTPQVYAYDVGTEANEYPGAGPNQPLRQANPNTGAVDGNNLVRRVTTNDIDASDDGFIYRPVNQRMIITITPNP